MYGPAFEENLALIQTMFGANSQAISTLALLLQTPYYGGFYIEMPVTPALLRLDPIWDPCAGIPLSKNSARKSSREPARFPSAIDSNRRTIWIADEVTNVEVRSLDFEVVDFLYYLSTASAIFPRRCKVDKATRQISDLD